jgi:hypothetical protein
MYKTYILPILEFSCPVFNPNYAKVINAIEKNPTWLCQACLWVHTTPPPKPQTPIKYSELLANYEPELPIMNSN